MNRTDTAPRVLAYLAEEHTVKEAAVALGLPRPRVKAAVKRLRDAGKLDRREDELGYVHWKAKASPAQAFHSSMRNTMGIVDHPAAYESEAHYVAEQWLWDAEQHTEIGPFWRSFVLDFFVAFLRQAHGPTPSPRERPSLKLLHSFTA